MRLGGAQCTHCSYLEDLEIFEESYHRLSESDLDMLCSTVDFEIYEKTYYNTLNKSDLDVLWPTENFEIYEDTYQTINELDVLCSTEDNDIIEESYHTFSESDLNEMSMSWPRPSWPLYVEITEQPKVKRRFPIFDDDRPSVHLYGALTTLCNKTWPAIKIHGYIGEITIIASCITKKGFLVHPYKLVGKNCNQGVFTARVNITDDAREYRFKNVYIETVSRKEMPLVLAVRKQIGVDPFQKGFSHENVLRRGRNASARVGAVRIAVQVFVRDDQGRDQILDTVYTDILYVMI